MRNSLTALLLLAILLLGRFSLEQSEAVEYADLKLSLASDSACQSAESLSYGIPEWQAEQIIRHSQQCDDIKHLDTQIGLFANWLGATDAGSEENLSLPPEWQRVSRRTQLRMPSGKILDARVIGDEIDGQRLVVDVFLLDGRLIQGRLMLKITELMANLLFQHTPSVKIVVSAQFEAGFKTSPVIKHLDTVIASVSSQLDSQ